MEKALEETEKGKDANVKNKNKLIGKKDDKDEFKSKSGLCKRGVQALLPTEDDKEAEFKKVAFEDSYHPKKNPNGYLNMLLEENHLMHDELKAKLQHISKTEEIPDDVFENGNF